VAENIPIRYVSENLGFLISYIKENNSLSIEHDRVIGPSASLDQAKLVAFEDYHVKNIVKTEIRILNKEELKQRPDDKSDETPVYFVLDVEDTNGTLFKIYVSSNKSSHNFKI
jgi:hypothetical protein